MPLTLTLPGIAPNKMSTTLFALYRVNIRTVAVQPEPAHG
jgi:hypothetical protein